MPDPFQYLISLLAAFGATLVAVVGARWILRSWAGQLASAIGVFAVSTGLTVGYGILHFEWDWPPANAINRFLTLVLPATVVIELISGLAAIPTNPDARHSKVAGLFLGLTMILRVGVFICIGRILLHNSVYLGASPGEKDAWSNRQTLIILIAGAVALGAAWRLLSRLANRAGSGSVVASLSISIMAAGLAIMLAGYIKGGVATFPISAALIGTIAVSPMARRDRCATNGRYFHGPIGIGIAALFSLLWIGCFFGQLRAVDAIVIFMAPLLCWISELSVFRGMNGSRKVLLRLIAVAIPLLVVLLNAKRSFDQKLAPLVADAAQAFENSF